MTAPVKLTDDEIADLYRCADLPKPGVLFGNRLQVHVEELIQAYVDQARTVDTMKPGTGHGQVNYGVPE